MKQIEPRVDKLEKVTMPPGLWALDDPVADAFHKWLRSLSKIEWWAFRSGIEDPIHLAELSLLVKEKADTILDLKGSPFQFAKEGMPELVKSAKARTSEAWRSLQEKERPGPNPCFRPEPTVAKRRKILEDALGRLEKDTFAWASLVFEDRQLERLYGVDNTSAYNFPHMWLHALELAGWLVSGCFFDVTLKRLQKRKARSEKNK